MNKKKIIIIGAGPGGLTAGMILSHRGFDVTIFEKEKNVGGRNAPIFLGNYRFDTGPTFLMLNFILGEMFEEVGEKAETMLSFKMLEPMYRLRFSDKDVFIYSDNQKMKQEITKHFLGNEPGLDRFFKYEEKRFRKLFPCLQIPYSTYFKLLNKNFIKAIPYFSIGNNLFSNLGNYFVDEQLKLSFTFQAKYIGMSPWECPAAFTMIPFIEHTYGIYHPIGGLYKISQVMAEIIKNRGGKVFTNTKVKQLILDHRTVKGVILDNGEKVFADEVVINADFSYAMTNLVPEGVLKKYSKQNISKKRFSCSTFMLYLGVKKKYNIPHHNVFFADDYRRNVENIFKYKVWSEDMSFYLQNASVTDPTLAPLGKSTIYILVPVPNKLNCEINWEKEKNNFADQVLSKVVQKTELKDLLSNIEVKKIITPDNWVSEYNVYAGATFNLAHNLGQMLVWRPRNKFEELENCYLVGGGTHPGSGLPTIYESGRITSNLISKKYGVKFKKPSPLYTKKQIVAK
ncbi:MAG: phytoene desaturase family protein [Endomicrobiia bacterium]